MANQKHIPFIPKMSTQFKCMQYIYCESETSSKVVPRADFMRLLAQQPCPMAQVNIDLEGGYAYLFPYCPERAEAFIQLNREMAAEYKRHYRNWQKLKAGTRKPELSLDMEMTEDSMTLGDQLSTEETPETLLLVKESFLGHRAAFNALAEADRQLLLEYLSANCNARELARRLNDGQQEPRGRDGVFRCGCGAQGQGHYADHAQDYLLGGGIEKNS